MLERSNLPAAAAGSQQLPKRFKRFEIRSALYSVKSSFSGHHCAWLGVVIVVQILIILFLNRASPPPPLPPLNREGFESGDGECKLGRVYVYDLPPMFNKDLLENCNDLDPWSSRCNAVSNGGFGPQAVGLDGIVPANLTSAWFWTDLYSGEVIYHRRMMDYRCRTADRDAAAAFYIPFYVGLAVGKYLWFNYTSKDRDHHAVEMLNWVKEQNPWRRSNGSDHFIMLGRLTWDFRRLTDNDGEWGTRFIYMPLMKNVVRLSVERNKWDPLEFSVPYPTPFHPSSESEIRHWQSFILNRPRRSLFTFVGATRNKIRNDFRAVLMSYCKSEPASCRLVDCSETRCYDGAPEILEPFLDSDFCLQPKGDGYTRRSTFDCLLAGSIPVFFWRGSFEDQYQWYMPRNAASYSVFIDREQTRNDSSIIRRVLERFSREEITEMRETIARLLPRLVYSRIADNGGDGDAFDIAIEGVLRRFRFGP